MGCIASNLEEAPCGAAFGRRSLYVISYPSATMRSAGKRPTFRSPILLGRSVSSSHSSGGFRAEYARVWNRCDPLVRLFVISAPGVSVFCLTLQYSSKVPKRSVSPKFQKRVLEEVAFSGSHPLLGGGKAVTRGTQRERKRVCLKIKVLQL